MRRIDYWKDDSVDVDDAEAEDSCIVGMSYSATHDELFIADLHNEQVWKLKLHYTRDTLRLAYDGSQHDNSPQVYSVCHLRESDTLVVCSREYGSDKSLANRLVALHRVNGEYCETERIKIEVRALQCSAMSDSRVLVGSKRTLVQQNSIVWVTRVQMTEGRIEYFAASGSDVAILYKDR